MVLDHNKTELIFNAEYNFMKISLNDWDVQRCSKNLLNLITLFNCFLFLKIMTIYIIRYYINF